MLRKDVLPQVPTSVNMEIAMAWHVTPCGLLQAEPYSILFAQNIEADGSS
jgi:hypothetical protein